MLLAAGYAPRYPQTSLDDEAEEHLRVALIHRAEQFVPQSLGR